MAKDIIIDLSLLTQKKQDKVLELLNELGLHVTKVKTALNKQRTEISVSSDFCCCLCCGAELTPKTFKSVKLGYMCSYCSSGACELGDAGYEDGHGQLEKAIGSHWDEEEASEEPDDDKDPDDEDEEEEREETEER